ncbi:MAG: hypothetical protein ACOC85_01350 [Thermoplasmatota archaeon]
MSREGVDKKSLRENLRSEIEEYKKIENKLNELKEEEERLKDELGKVRDHIEYYDALVSDMKKKIKGRGDFNILDRL